MYSIFKIAVAANQASKHSLFNSCTGRMLNDNFLFKYCYCLWGKLVFLGLFIFSFVGLGGLEKNRN